MRKFEVGDHVISIDDINAFDIYFGDKFIVTSVGHNDIDYFISINYKDINNGNICFYEYRFKLDIKCERTKKLKKLYIDNQ